LRGGWFSGHARIVGRFCETPIVVAGTADPGRPPSEGRDRSRLQLRTEINRLAGGLDFHDQLRVGPLAR
jgi:hypothetical protein